MPNLSRTPQYGNAPKTKLGKAFDVKTSPSHLLRCEPDSQSLTKHSVWLASLKIVAAQSNHVSKTLNTHYHSLAQEFRPKAALIIAASDSGDHMRTPDTTYLYAWLTHTLLQTSKTLTMGYGGQNTNLGGRSASVLSAWLQENAVLRESLSELCGEAFNKTHLYSYPPHVMETLIDNAIPKKYRTASFYTKLLFKLPQFLPAAAPHIEETVCLRQMDSAQCKIAASLGWRALYPQSTTSKEVDEVLGMMKTLDTFDPMVLHTWLSLSPTPVIDSMPLPSETTPYL